MAWKANSEKFSMLLQPALKTDLCDCVKYGTVYIFSPVILIIMFFIHFPGLHVQKWITSMLMGTYDLICIRIFMKQIYDWKQMNDVYLSIHVFISTSYKMLERIIW